MAVDALLSAVVASHVPCRVAGIDMDTMSVHPPNVRGSLQPDGRFCRRYGRAVFLALGLKGGADTPPGVTDSSGIQ
jgi:hypothetical protein